MIYDEDVIGYVSSFMTLCANFTTEGSNRIGSYQSEYFALRKKLLETPGLNLPVWIKISIRTEDVMAHVKMTNGSGHGSWDVRRTYFYQEKMKIIESSVCEGYDGNDKINVNCNEHGVLNGLAIQQAPVMPINSAAYRSEIPSGTGKKKVFVVHGHNGNMKYEVARLIDKEGFESVIFHENMIKGRSILQKLIELTNDVVYAVVLYTACDVGRPVSDKRARPRARQNVVFEHGFLIAKLGQERVTAICEPNVEVPSDLDGVLYINSDDNWMYQLSQELKELKK
ncbi:hypothetical protein SMKC081_23140 [Serratia marcescens]|uniref:TIR domain-containing protein n=1 Tax=Serratia marcescens TaxID=615 RepID=UPI000EFD05C0|nr:nucleotide-binding protein [Serratia marcescens]BEN74169.1 hypothetical protein SMKC081_23140 [Serratia marcescens]